MSLNSYMTDEEHDTAFWARFHPNDHNTLCPHQLNYPLHFEDVIWRACKPPWLQEPQFKVPNTRVEPADLVLEPMLMPLPTPIHPVAPHPFPECTPEIHSPASAPLILQHFKDPDITAFASPAAQHSSKSYSFTVTISTCPIAIAA
ncbi:hypothetical protein EI94DRAFT_1800903 [Lactarius quietus]|nr:hypothetical protein EI94DRAFT_1800903 [Lactarius quietus]